MDWNKELLFVGSFIVFLIFFYMFFGSSPTYFLLLLVLAGQVLVNRETIANFFKEVVS